MEVCFDKKWNRWNTNSRKWAFTKDPSTAVYTECEKDEIIPMWVADMDFATPDCVINAIKKRLEHPILGYTVLPDEYIDAISSWQERRYNTKGITKENILYQNSVLGGLASAIKVFTLPGDYIVTNQSTYIGFQNTVKDLGRNLAFSDTYLDNDGIYRMDFEQMEKTIIDNKCTMMIFCSPHNPTGRVWEKWEIEKIVSLCHKYNLILFSDEVWADFVMQEGIKHIPTQSVNDTAKQLTIACYSPNKTFNLASLIGAYSICYNPFINSRLKRAGDCTHYNNPNILTVTACIGAYNDGAQWVDQLIPYIRKNQEYMYNFFMTRKGVKTYMPQGTYNMWVDVSECGKDMDTVISQLLAVGVIINDGRPFRGPTHLRFNLACPFENVKRACEKMKSVFEEK